MQLTSKRVFTHEYRAHAFKFVTEQGMGVTEAAKKLALSVKTYSRWVRVARAGTLISVDNHRVQPVTDLQAEVSRLKRKLAIACEERDILKNRPRGAPPSSWVETAVAERALAERGYDIAFHDIYVEQFDPVQPTGEKANTSSSSPVVEQHCSELARADLIVICHPNWWGQPPAILKG